MRSSGKRWSDVNTVATWLSAWDCFLIVERSEATLEFIAHFQWEGLFHFLFCIYNNCACCFTLYCLFLLCCRGAADENQLVAIICYTVSHLISRSLTSSCYLRNLQCLVWWFCVECDGLMECAPATAWRGWGQHMGGRWRVVDRHRKVGGPTCCGRERLWRLLLFDSSLNRIVKIHILLTKTHLYVNS